MSIMNGVADPHRWSFDRITERLARRESGLDLPYGDRMRASVAMILHQADNDVEILFIQRADHHLDHW